MLVAETKSFISGFIAFTPVTINGERCSWYGLGPVAVVPEVQQQGIGSALITKGLRRLKEDGAEGVVLLREPDYYSRFGFRYHTGLICPYVPENYFMGLPFIGQAPVRKGRVSPSFY